MKTEKKMLEGFQTLLGEELRVLRHVPRDSLIYGDDGCARNARQKDVGIAVEDRCLLVR